MKISRRQGAISQILQIFVQNASSTTGAGLTALTAGSPSLVFYYHRDTDSTSSTQVTLTTMTVGTYKSGGFAELNSAVMPGFYQLCPPDAAFAVTAASVVASLRGATNMADLPIEVDLDSQVDVYLWNGTAVVAPNTAGVPGVDVVRVSGATVSTSLAQFGVNMVSPTTTQIITINGSIPGGAGGLMVAGTNSAVTVAALTISGAFAATNGGNDVRVNMVSPTTTQILTFSGALPGAIDGLMRSGNNSGTTIASIIVSGVVGINGSMTVSGAMLFNSSLTVSGVITATNAGNQIIGVSAATVSAGQLLGLTISSVIGPVGSVVGGLGGSVGGNVSGNVVGSVNSVNAGVTVSTNADKTGYSVSTVGDKSNYTITSNIKKNQSLLAFEYLMTDAITHSPATGLTVTVNRSIDGGAFAAGTLSAVTEIGNGIYAVDFGSGDLNGNVITLQATAIGADTAFERIVTQP